MKKVAVLLTAVMALTMSVPAAAATLEFEGSLESRFEYNKDTGDYKLHGETGVDVQANLKAEGGNRIRAVVELAPWRIHTVDGDGNPDQDFAEPWTSQPLSLEINKAYLQSEGSMWHGGPDVTTTIGDVAPNYNDWVAHLSDRRGITLEGLQVGPANFNAFYAWEAGVGSDQIVGGTVAGSVDGIDLDAAFVRFDGDNELAVTAGTSVMDDMRVDGTVAMDANRNLAYRVNGEFQASPNTTVSAGYRITDGFVSMFPRLDDGSPVAYDGNNGFNIAAETVQQGVTLAAEYDDPTEKAKLSAATEMHGFKLNAETELESREVTKTVFGAETDLDVDVFTVNTKYTGTLEINQDMKHELAASTSTNMVPYLQGLGLGGTVTLQGSAVDYSAEATYSAPNGLDLGAHYTTVNDKGFYLSGGMKVSF